MKVRAIGMAVSALMILGITAAMAAPALKADQYRVDPVHSTVLFAIKHMNVSNTWGRFNDISGTFALDEENPAGSQFRFTVKTESIDTANAKRDQHLRNADFLNAAQFPTMTFQSKSVKKTSDGRYQVAGELTLHGVTKPLTITIDEVGIAKDPMSGGQRAGFETEFTIRRSEFGMTNMLNMVGDPVRIIVSLEGTQS